MVQLPDLKLEIDEVGGESDEMELSNPGENGGELFRQYQAVSGDRVKLTHLKWYHFWQPSHWII